MNWPGSRVSASDLSPTILSGVRCLGTASVDSPEWEGEEYDVLLRYVDDQASKIKTHGGQQDDDDDDKKTKYTRKWYAPWKKTKVDGGSKKVGWWIPLSGRVRGLHKRRCLMAFRWGSAHGRFHPSGSKRIVSRV